MNKFVLRNFKNNHYCEFDLFKYNIAASGISHADDVLADLMVVRSKISI